MFGSEIAHNESGSCFQLPLLEKGTRLVELKETRFGTLEFEEKFVITFEQGILGFPLSSRYILFPHEKGSPFSWLQSVDEAAVAFLVVNPLDFFSDYEVVIEDADVEMLQVENADDLELLTLVTIPEGHPEEMRTNLAGPVVINASNRRGKQLLMREYSTQQPLVPNALKTAFLSEVEENRSQTEA